MDSRGVGRRNHSPQKSNLIQDWEGNEKKNGYHIPDPHQNSDICH
jgi:hypothetical protein